MLTAHTRVLIKRHLPEVREVWVGDEFRVIDLAVVRLTLDAATDDVISMTWQHGHSTVRRSRLRDDYSDDIEVLSIEPEMRARLVRVFGQLNFGDDE